METRYIAISSAFWARLLIVLSGYTRRGPIRNYRSGFRKPIENHYLGSKMAAVAYRDVELKNEPGIREDGWLQAALSLRKYVAQEHVELLVITPVLPRH
jgi:hypothetical protein